MCRRSTLPAYATSLCIAESGRRTKQTARLVAELGIMPTPRIALAALLLVTAIFGTRFLNLVTALRCCGYRRGSRVRAQIGGEPPDPPGLGSHRLRRAAARHRPLLPPRRLRLQLPPEPLLPRLLRHHPMPRRLGLRDLTFPSVSACSLAFFRDQVGGLAFLQLGVIGACRCK
ncbi:hypothetical protein MUK42_05716 [Musa troglodytarum]|uniref:Uncharacterized protein n=1 Tax=Musa troglodytarum TaxID=320322 RepID=A0A9E7JK67_9LILI|nr:hypothetical protein MUK42_05716 [Musa troglodytarum]